MARRHKKTQAFKTLAPNEHFDLVIMNPPYTRATNHEGKHADIVNPAFAAFGMNEEQQRRLADRTKYLLKNVKSKKSNNHSNYERPKVANGYAGLGSYFFQIADMKLNKSGQLAMVLPLSFVVGASWQEARRLIAQHYEDIIVVTIAQSKTKDCSFSADTSMAECLLIARKTDTPPSSNRIISVALNIRPKNFIEASEIAKLVKIHKIQGNIPRLEDAPIGGALLKAGDTSLGQILDVPISHDGACPALSLRSPEILQVAWILHNRQQLWLPRQSQEESVKIPIATIDKIAKRGSVDREINGKKRDGTPLGPFDIVPIVDKTPSYPALWNHDAKKEQRMIVAPDTEGRVRVGLSDLAAACWCKASRIHYNRDCQFNSQPLIVAVTNDITLGGRAWPSLYDFPSVKHENAFALWSNSTLGLLCHLYKANLQQSGRGITTITQISSFPTLDTTDKRVNLDAADAAFHRLKTQPLLPLYKADEDATRHAIDKAILVDTLNLNPDLLAPDGAFTLIRKKICSEPAIHGGKKS